MAYRAGTCRNNQRWNRKSIPANGPGNTIWSAPNNVSPMPVKILIPPPPTSKTQRREEPIRHRLTIGTGSEILDSHRLARSSATLQARRAARAQRFRVGSGGNGRSQVLQAEASGAFRVPHRGQVMPLPKRWTSSIATPMVSTKPKVMDMKPSNVRHVTT